MISVVIPAYNEEKNIARCLSAFASQKTTEKFEVILVDNNSSDQTIALAKTFLKKIPLRIISEREKGRGNARAAGFATAKGEIILSTDADAIAPPDWIEKMSQAFSDPQISAVTGICKTIDASPIKSMLITHIYPYAMHLYALVYRHHWLSGFNFGIRKDLYEAAGGFRQINGLEDIDLGFRVYKLDKIHYMPIWVYMSGRRFHKGILRGFQSYLKSYIDYRIKKKSQVYLSDVRG